MKRKAKTRRPSTAVVEAFSPIPEHRRETTGVGRLAKAEWIDPEDVRPNAARTARRVKGFTAFDSIRWMRLYDQSGIETHHVIAADKLRELADAVTYGYSGDWLPVFTAMMAGPRSGPRPGEIARVRAAERLRRLWQRFVPDQQMLLIFVVLQNHRISEWVQLRFEMTGRRPDHKGEKRLLLGLLDQIWKYFETELTREIDTGRRQQVG